MIRIRAMKCYYCNLRPGIYQQTNGKYACEPNYGSCPMIREKRDSGRYASYLRRTDQRIINMTEEE